MKKLTKLLTFLLACLIMFTASACAKKKEETAAEKENDVCTYNFPLTGFGFDLPEGTELEKGTILTNDFGPESMGGLSLAYPIYANFTREEYNS